MDIIKSHSFVASAKAVKHVSEISKNHNDVDVFTFEYKRKEYTCIDCGGMIVIIHANGRETDINDEDDLRKIIK